MPKPKPKQKVVTSTSSSKSQSQKPQTQQPTQSSPNWPPFPQRVHYNHAPFPSLTPLIPAQVLVAERFWDAALCRTYLSFLRTLDLTTTPGRPKKGEALRVNDRFQVADEAFAWRLWKEGGVQKLVANAVAGEDGANFEDEAGYGNGYAEDGVAGVAPMRDEVAARRQEELKSKEGELWYVDRRTVLCFLCSPLSFPC